MPIFVTVNGPLGVTSFIAENLKTDSGVPGNLTATSITDLPVSLPNGRVFLPTMWSFRGSDLVSYMVGEYADAPPPIFEMLAGMAEAAAPVSEERPLTPPESDPASEPTPVAPARKRSRR
jgi:hypothetical protein